MNFNTKKTLVISDKYLEYDTNSDYLILWDAVNFNNRDIISLPNYVEENSVTLRNLYLEYIYEFSQKKIEEKKIIEILEIKENFSYWWQTLISQKLNATSSTYINDIIKIFALEKIILNKNIKKIKLISNNKVLKKVIYEYCKKNYLEFNFNSYSSKINKLNFRTYIPKRVKAILWILFYFIKHWKFKGEFVKKSFRKDYNVSLFSYFDNFKYNNNEFYSNNWNDLPELILKSNKKINWFHIYTKLKNGPNTKESIKIINKLNRKRKNINHYFLDSFLSIGVFKKVYKDLFKFNKIVNKYQLESFSFQTKLSDFNIFLFLKNDWIESIKGSTLASNLVHYNLFELLLKKLNNQKIGIYLQENQSWEYSLINNWKKNNHRKLIGYQQSTVRFWDLRNFNYYKTYSKENKNNYPRPNFVCINNETAKKYYLKNGYPSKEIVEVEALRYQKLIDVKINSNNKFNDKLIILVILEGIKEYDEIFIDMIIKSKKNLNNKCKFVIKCHPQNIITRDNIENFIFFSEKNLHHLFYICDIVFVSNSGSASVEALYFNKPINILLDNKRPNLNPLRDNKKILNIFNYEEIIRAIEKYNKKQKYKYNYNFFYLDKSMNKWKKFLK